MVTALKTSKAIVVHLFCKFKAHTHDWQGGSSPSHQFDSSPAIFNTRLPKCTEFSNLVSWKEEKSTEVSELSWASQEVAHITSIHLFLVRNQSPRHVEQYNLSNVI